jgi:CobQ-like glutamine amidotransferase family enzyme
VTAPLVVVNLYPSLLQPEGDDGNSIALVHRARQRGLTAELVVVHPGDQLPAADVVCLGGSEDTDVAMCARLIVSEARLRRLADDGAVVLGVGAGFAVLGTTFVDAAGRVRDGAGLLDVEMSAANLASGPVVTRPSTRLGLPEMSGYEHHRGRARLGPQVAPLAEIEIGVGNGSAAGPGHDGAVVGRVVGSWLHGPLLPRNPAMTDLLLGWAAGDRPLGPIPHEEDALAGVVRERRIVEARRPAG